MITKLKELTWAAWISFALSIFAIAFPFLFPNIYPRGILDYFVITTPLGVIAGVLAGIARNWWLLILAIIAAFSPMIIMWAAFTIVRIIYIFTLGNYPSDDWL
ncbi:MAG: hypothetical protein Q4A92_07660 [Corynebacterium sp.]|nr:hypothetical protein [Corynebacterium sp.]